MSKIGISSKIQRLLKESRLYCQSGRLEKAKLIYQDLLKSIPFHPEVLGNLGTIELKSGNTELGVKLLKQSISVDPTQCNFLSNLGNGLLDLVNPNEAFFYFETALKINPYSSELHYNRARALKLLNRNEDAIEALKSSIQYNPKNYLAYMNLGFLHNEQGQFQEAIKNYNEAIEIDPNNFQLFYNRGITFENLKQYEESLKDYNHSIRLNNNFGMAFFNKSGLLIKLKKNEEALTVIDQAIVISPHNANYFIKKAYIYEGLNNYEFALNIYDHVLRIDPNNSEAMTKQSYLQLSLLDFKSGWELYKNRWWNLAKPQFSIPELNDFTITNKKIFIWSEQGIGDQIIYSSLFFDAFKTKNEFCISLEPRLVDLYKRSFFWAQNVIFISSEEKVKESDYDFHLPICNLGIFFRTSIESFNSHPIAYLKSNNSQVKDLRKRIKKDNYKICGISWKSRNSIIGEEKSLSLNQLLPVLKLTNTIFIDLQYGDTSWEKKNIYNLFGIEIKSISEIDNLNNLDGLTSLIDVCDFIVTISNATAHIAGGLNKKTYLLLPNSFGKLWYWGQSNDGSLWYPSVEIYRCPKSGLWDEAIENLSERLRKIYE